ncbi:hypothetical protein B0H14DRAFT_3435535 [Mycena olivaceomarginata]|nr:hypothetical protein B0H14DRAFT_3435535 [Mycena olivaceomarginata]
MPRGKQSPLPADQLAYLESGLAEFLEKQPHLTTFWTSIERGWFERWRVEPTLGLLIIDSSIEESPLTEEQEAVIGQEEAKIRKKIHSWYNNRSQKEKRVANATASSSVSTGALNDLVASLSRKGGRRKQKIEIWRKRNGPLITEALADTNFSSLMGTAPPGETPDERKLRIRNGHQQQMALRRQVEKKLFEEASEAEMAAVTEDYKKQTPKQRVHVKAETPEDFQRGLDQLAPMLKAVHGVISDVTGGWVGTTMLTGPVPKEGGKIGTHSYCNGVTPAGHTMDQAVSRWATQWVKPLQQFGKKVFDHRARRERAIGSSETVREEDASQPPSLSGARLYSMSPLPEFSLDADDSSLENAFGDKSTPPPPPPPLHEQGSLSPSPQDYNHAPLPHADEIPIDPILLGFGGGAVSVASTATQEPANCPVQSMGPVPGSGAASRPPSPIGNPGDDFEMTSISAESSSHSGLSTSLVGFRYDAGMSAFQRPQGLSLPPHTHPWSDGSNAVARLHGDAVAPLLPLRRPQSPPLRRPARSPAAAATPTQSPAVAVQSSAATPVQSSAATPRAVPRCRCDAHADVSTIGGAHRATSSLHIRAVSAVASDVQCTTGATEHGHHKRECWRYGARDRVWAGGGKAVADRESGTGDNGDGDDDIGMGEGQPAAATCMAPPGDALHETVSREWLMEIRAWEKKRDDAVQRAARNRDHGIHHFPPPPPGHEALLREPAALGVRPLQLQEEPAALGPRSRRPPTGYQAPPAKRTMDQIKKDAAAKKEAKLAATAAKKRSRPDSENQEPVVTKKSRGGSEGGAGNGRRWAGDGAGGGAEGGLADEQDDMSSQPEYHWLWLLLVELVEGAQII